MQSSFRWVSCILLSQQGLPGIYCDGFKQVLAAVGAGAAIPGIHNIGPGPYG